MPNRILSRARGQYQPSGLFTGRHSRWETTRWICKSNRVSPEFRIADRELGPVAVDDQGSGIAIDRHDDLFARVARIGEDKAGL